MYTGRLLFSFRDNLGTIYKTRNVRFELKGCSLYFAKLQQVQILRKSFVASEAKVNKYR